jgi:hypothetical protein
MKHTKQDERTVTGFVVRNTKTNEYLTFKYGCNCWTNIDEAMIFDYKTEKTVLKHIGKYINSKTTKVIKVKRTIVKTTTTEVEL